MHRFRQRWVWEDGVHQFLFRRFHIARDCVALDRLGHFGPDHVRAEQFSGFGVEHRLDEAFGFAHRYCFAVADKTETANLNFAARGFRLGFGHADACDLRGAISAAGNVRSAEGVNAFDACDFFDADDAFVAGFVR